MWRNNTSYVYEGTNAMDLNPMPASYSDSPFPLGRNRSEREEGTHSQNVAVVSAIPEVYSRTFRVADPFSFPRFVKTVKPVVGKRAKCRQLLFTQRQDCRRVYRVRSNGRRQPLRGSSWGRVYYALRRVVPVRDEGSSREVRFRDKITRARVPPTTRAASRNCVYV